MVPDDELAKPKRRNFSAAYKLAILKQYEALEDPGAKGAFLRREGLYSSHIVEWRRARDAGALAELAPKVRGAKASAEQRELQRAQRKIARLRRPARPAPQSLGNPGKSFRALGQAASRERRGPIAAEAESLACTCIGQIAPLLGTKAACVAVGRPRATHYRQLRPARLTPRVPRPAPPNKLGPAEVGLILSTLNSARFADASPTQAYYVLLDEGTYIASPSTFYRVLRANKLVRERRRQASHPPRVRPELVARRPNVVWCWDITKLRGPARGEYYDLYVVLDIFSRYVVAWCVAPSESGELAKELIADAISRHQVPPGQLSVHADRGRYARTLSQTARGGVLVLDDFLLSPASVEACRDLLEVVEDRSGLRSTVVASQLPVDKWHPSMADPTLADAVLDHVCQAAHRITLKGASMRKRQPGSEEADNA